MPRLRALAAAGTLLTLGPVTAAHAADVYPTWTSAGSLTTDRFNPASARLAGDDALLIGGSYMFGAKATVERFDGLTKLWSAAPSLSAGRGLAGAVTLADGRVLVAGGQTTQAPSDPPQPTLSSAEIFDPVQNQWTPTGSMQRKRSLFGLERLADGRVLAVGGRAGQNVLAEGAELFDPLTGVWSPAGSMAEPLRMRPSVARLNDGRVLVTGGENGTTGELKATEIFNPADNAWTTVAPLHEGRAHAPAVVLQDGRVLVAGGAVRLGAGQWPGSSTTFEIYDPAANAWTAPAPTAIRHGAAARLTRLADGRVVLTGGDDQGKSAEIYDPVTNAWTALPEMDAYRVAHLALALSDGSVLVAGGGFATTSQRLLLAAPSPTPTSTATPTPTTHGDPGVTPTPVAVTPTSRPKLTVRRAQVKASTATVSVTCANAAGTPCRVNLRLTKGKAAYATKTVTVPAGRARTVALTLNAKGKRALKTRTLKVTLRVDGAAQRTLTFRKAKR